MKKIFFFITLFGFVHGFAQEEILSYNIDIQVEESGSLLMEEQITVRTQGININRGIYRTFPTRYKDRLGNKYKVGFEVLEVLRDGKKEDYHIKNVSNGKAVYIGNKNYTLPHGVYTYTLRFRTDRQIGFFEDYDELYFNAVGGDWMFAIREAQVVVTLPERAEIGNITAYSGTAGSTSCHCNYSKERNRAVFKMEQALHPYQQFTIALSWPKGVIPEPTFWEKTMRLFKDNYYLLFVLGGLFLIFMSYYKNWRRVGVDPPKGTIIPLFDPPEGLSPAQAGFLNKLGFSQQVTTAAIVNMAVKGYLTIEQKKKKYTLLVTDASKESLLAAEEQAIARTLFSSRTKIELDNANHRTFSQMKMSVINSLKKSLKPDYLRFNAKYLSRGAIYSILLIVIAFIIAPVLVAVVLLILLLIAGGVFSYLMKAPTPKGRKIMDDIEGFKMYVNTAEKRQLDINEPDLTPERFEALLPYAIALGVENKWGKRFDTMLKNSMHDTNYQPAWYSGTGRFSTFHAANFTGTVGKSFSSAISASSTPPGSSSGSGGGGFSGGGGGGGGGGGW